MFTKIYAIIVSVMLLTLSGCTQSEAVQLTEQPTDQPTVSQTVPTAAADACKFIPTDEIEKVQGAKIVEAKSSSPNADNFVVSQCYYLADDNSKSVVLSVYRADPARPDAKSPKIFWKERFETMGKEDESAGKKEKSTPPQPIAKLGDQAYWLDNKIGGALYVLNGDEFFRVSVGGTPDAKLRISKAKSIAQAALKRL